MRYWIIGAIVCFAVSSEIVTLMFMIAVMSVITYRAICAASERW